MPADVNEMTEGSLQDAVFDLAEQVGSAPIWELLVNLGMELPARARERAARNPLWQPLADRIEAACRTEQPERIWSEVRSAVRMYESAIHGHHRRAAGGAGPQLRTPVALGLDDFFCSECGGEQIVLDPRDPDDVLGRCADCRRKVRLGGVHGEKVERWLDGRKQAVSALLSTRKTIAQLDERAAFDCPLTLVPLCRLEAQHMRRIRTMTRQLLDLTEPSPDNRLRL